MKIQFKELKKAVEYINKNGDHASVDLSFAAKDGTINRLRFAFSDLKGDDIVIEVPDDERAFSKLTRTERF